MLTGLAEYLYQPFLSAGKSLYWGNFLCAIVIGVVFLVFVNKRDGSSGVRACRFLFPAKVFLHPSSLLDYRYYFVVKFIVFVTLPYVLDTNF